MLDLDPLVLKTAPCRFRGADIRLDLSHALFSSFDIDVGTRLLFKALGRDEALEKAKSVLDAGSGVGVIGLAVAKAFPDCRVEAWDRDLLAVAFTERNRAKNRIANAFARPGLIGAGIPGSYDFILSNVPAKAGPPVIERFIADCSAALNPGGRLGIVVVNPLVDSTRAWLKGAGFAVIREERGSMHRAFVAVRESELAAALPALPGGRVSGAETRAAAPGAQDAAGGGGVADCAEAGPEVDAESWELSTYRRTRAAFSLGGRKYAASGFWGLPDFDTIGYGQALAVDLLMRAASGCLVRDALVVEPGLGHAALWIALSLGPERLSLASRDLLSLAGTLENLRSLPRSLSPGGGRESPSAASDPAGSMGAPGPADGDRRGEAAAADASGVAYRALSRLRLDGLGPATLDLLLEFADPVPEYDWIGPMWERASRLCKKGAAFVLVAEPTEAARVERQRPKGFRLLHEKRRRGFAASAWRRE